MKSLFIRHQFLAHTPRILLMLILITQSIFIIYQLKHPVINQVTTDNKTLSNNNTRIISKAALDILIKKASDEEYLLDVLNGTPKLPIPKYRSQLMPASKVLQPPNENDFQNQIEIQKQKSFQINQPIKIQECYYQGQLYLPGDIVKTNQGWIRCVPMATFGKSKQLNRVVWMANNC